MNHKFRRWISVVLCWCLIITGIGQPLTASAQLPQPGTMVLLSEPAAPVALMGLKVFPQDPFRLDFIVDKGDQKNKEPASDLKQSSERLVKYFLAGLTIPQEDLWVNLSPYEGDRVIVPALGKTDLGRDLLEQDYVLKQVAASVLYPQGEEGKKFWKEVYARAHEKFGTIDIPVDTFNKVWIVPDQAKVFENKDRVFIVDSRLKVMLESDYLAEEKQKSNALDSAAPDTVSAQPTESRELTKAVMREIIIPVLEKEVNEGANFATLRQVYHSLILAIWYKRKIHDSILAASYVDRKKVTGVTIDDPQMAEKIWSLYVEAFKKGAYNYIQEEVDPLTQETIPRKYFSGGMGFQELQVTQEPQIALPQMADRYARLQIENRPVENAQSVSKGPLGYMENARVRVPEGQEETLRAVMPNMDAEGAKNYRVLLHSNKDGAWKDGEALDFVGVKDGKAVFETKVKPETGFAYTFVFERKSDGYREWADMPFGNGTVTVDRKFQGNIAFVAMEFGPLVKKGGQGDVTFELPRNLVKAGVNATVVLPYFKKLAVEYANKGYVIEDVPGMEIKIDFNRRSGVTLKVKRTVIDGITVYLLDAVGSDLFVEPYSNAANEFYESILLSQGATELLVKLGKPLDIVNFHDHHAALTPLYMAKKHADFFAKTGRVFTIHNIGYQGEYQDTGLIEEMGLGVNDEMNRLMIKSGKINMMALPPGLAKTVGYRGFYVGTVSPTYADEIRHTQFELDKLLQEMGSHFGGIMNGIDYELNNPATDSVLRMLKLPTFSIDEGVDKVRASKAEIKRFLRHALRKEALMMPDWEKGKIGKIGYLPELKEGEDRLLVGTIGRHVGQKQVDVIADMIENMVEGRTPPLPMDVIIAGPSDRPTDDRASIKRVIELIDRAREKGINIVVLDGFVQETANVMYAGLDAILMPSAFEPSGIVQQLAKRYGTLPIVRLTGGLVDTVFEGGPGDNGFVFPGTFRRMDAKEDLLARAQNTVELSDAVRRAVETYYNDQELWRTKIENGMRDNSNWELRQKDYLNVYAWLKDQVGDNAQKGVAQVSPTGGIDLTGDRINIQTSGEAVNFTGLWSPEGLKNIKINGLMPTIISVIPERNLSGFLGLPQTAPTY